MPRIGGVQDLSTPDLTKVYWQISVHPTDKPKTAFATPSGLYHFTMMPFGLNEATVSFQRVMDKALKGVQDCAVTYLDDILIYSLSWESHLLHLCRVLQVLHHTGLTVNLRKSKVGQSTVQYLGFCVGQGQIWAVPDKVAALRNVPL